VGTGWVLEMAMKEAVAAAKGPEAEERQEFTSCGLNAEYWSVRLPSLATHVILTVARSSPKLVPVVCDSCLQVQPFPGGPKRLHSSIEDIYHTTLSLPIHSF